MLKATRGVMVAALTAAAIGLLTPTAYAAQDAELDLFFNDVLIAAGSDGDTENLLVTPSEPVVLDDFTIRLDFADLAGVAMVSAVQAHRCEATATTLVCTNPFPTSINDAINILPDFLFKPTPEALSGVSGEILVTVTATNVATASTTATVTVGEGVDLDAEGDIELTGAPGDPIATDLHIRNAGSVDADGVVAWFQGDYGFTTTKQHSNCSYVDGQLKLCTFDTRLAAGTSYVTSEPVPLALKPDNRAPGMQWLYVVWMTPAELEVLKNRPVAPEGRGEPGSGSPLRLVEEPSVRALGDQVDVDFTNNSTDVTVTVTGDNPADLAAVGGAATGAVGDVVTLDLGVKSLGPATIDHGRSGEIIAEVVIQLPPGTSLIEIPAGCKALKEDSTIDKDNPDNIAARAFACWTTGHLFKVGTRQSFAVKLRVDQVVAGATGTAKIRQPHCHPNCPPLDHNPANDIAEVVLNGGGTGGGLPVTGLQIGLTVGVGVLLLTAGVVVFGLGRRRRVRVN